MPGYCATRYFYNHLLACPLPVNFFPHIFFVIFTTVFNFMSKCRLTTIFGRLTFYPIIFFYENTHN
nr:hypothetical protein [Klebsiella quasipneumoniae]UWM21137.1 hypothetical protein [Escherichia coli]UWM21438.1 hypothetical protein [Escherichia coli]UWM22415.1 hypothetical protein [Escherichia coli]